MLCCRKLSIFQFLFVSLISEFSIGFVVNGWRQICNRWQTCSLSCLALPLLRHSALPLPFACCSPFRLFGLVRLIHNRRRRERPRRWDRWTVPHHRIDRSPGRQWQRHDSVLGRSRDSRGNRLSGCVVRFAGGLAASVLRVSKAIPPCLNSSNAICSRSTVSGSRATCPGNMNEPAYNACSTAKAGSLCNASLCNSVPMVPGGTRLLSSPSTPI